MYVVSVQHTSARQLQPAHMQTAHVQHTCNRATLWQLSYMGPILPLRCIQVQFVWYVCWKCAAQLHAYVHATHMQDFYKGWWSVFFSHIIIIVQLRAALTWLPAVDPFQTCKQFILFIEN